MPKILIADDDPVLLKYLSAVLEPWPMSSLSPVI
jgi:CheY-like chemotaxis protein